jgi:hypothetical protein
MGTTNWADIFTTVGCDPDAANQKHLERQRNDMPLVASRASSAKPLAQPQRTRLHEQMQTLVHRQIHLIAADR